MRILGTRGEMADDTVRYLTEDNRPLKEDFVIHRDVITGTIAFISFAGETVYRNPFRTDVPMNEDEIAIATTLLRMGGAVRGGERHYALEDGATDAIFAILMHEAADTGRIISAKPHRMLPSET